MIHTIKLEEPREVQLHLSEQQDEFEELYDELGGEA